MNSSIQQQIDKVMPALLPQMKQTIHDEVVKQIQEFASKSEPRPFIFLVVTLPSLLTVTTEGDKANVKVPLSSRTVELTMQRDATGWKVTEFKDDVVIQRVVDGVMKDLPAIGSIDWSDVVPKKSQRKRRGR